MIPRLGAKPEDVRQAAKHTLFVEGCGEDAIDVLVLKELLHETVGIQALGASYSVKSVAEALHANHPHYYFLIDRDHRNDAEVEDSWKTFPNPEKNNLLIWRRKEIESYFLIPEYLEQSEYLHCKVDELKTKILQFQQARLYFDVANQVVVFFREKFKTNWIKMFSGPAEFNTKDVAIERLINAPEF